MVGGLGDLENVRYCYKWNYRRGRPGTALTAEEAAQRDADGEEYTAIMPPREGSSQPVLVTIVWKNKYAEVKFLDDRGRQWMLYSFKRVDVESLFLDQVLVWEYPNDRPGLRLADADRIEDIVYREDGYVKRTITSKADDFVETREYTDVPVDDNWEPVPDFGDYSSLARWERGRGG